MPRVAAFRAPAQPELVTLVESSSSSDEDEPEVTGASRKKDEEETEKWNRWALLMLSVQSSVDQARLSREAEGGPGTAGTCLISKRFYSAALAAVQLGMCLVCDAELACEDIGVGEPCEPI